MKYSRKIFKRKPSKNLKFTSPFGIIGKPFNRKVNSAIKKSKVFKTSIK